MVNNFDIKCTRDKYLQHLMSALRDKYTISVDMEYKLFCGITLKWDYIKLNFRLSMPDYVLLAIERFKHCRPTAKTYAHYDWKEPVYGPN